MFKNNCSLSNLVPLTWFSAPNKQIITEMKDRVNSSYDLNWYSYYKLTMRMKLVGEFKPLMERLFSTWLSKEENSILK